MEDDSIPISGSEEGGTATSDNGDFTMNSNDEPVAMATGRNLHATSSGLESTAPTGMSSQAEPSSSSALVEHSVINPSTTCPQPVSRSPVPETLRVSQELRLPFSMGASAARETEFRETFPWRSSSTQEPASRRRLSSRSPPSHRSPPYQRSAPRDVFLPSYSSSHGRSSSPSQQAFPHPSSHDVTAQPAASSLQVDDQTQRTVTAYYESLQREFEDLSKDLREMTENRCCRVCLDREASVVFMPCAHLSTCASCASQLSTCPICRSLVQYTHVAIIG